MKKEYLNKILDFLNKDYNRGTYPNNSSNFGNFYLYKNLLNIAKKDISIDLVNNYGIERDSEDFFWLIKNWIRKNYGNGSMALPGDTIEMVEMIDDPNPIEPGTKGVVRNISTVYTFGEDHLMVEWENGSKLNVIVGIDKIKVLGVADNKYFINSYSWA